MAGEVEALDKATFLSLAANIGVKGTDEYFEALYREVVLMRQRMQALDSIDTSDIDVASCTRMWP